MPAIKRKDANSYTLKLESMQPQIFISERQDQQQAIRARQAGKEASKTSKPPTSVSHLIEAQNGKAQKGRLAIGGDQEKCARKDQKIENSTVCACLIKIFQSELIEDNEHDKESSI